MTTRIEHLAINADALAMAIAKGSTGMRTMTNEVDVEMKPYHELARRMVASMAWCEGMSTNELELAVIDLKAKSKEGGSDV